MTTPKTMIPIAKSAIKHAVKILTDDNFLITDFEIERYSALSSTNEEICTVKIHGAVNKDINKTASFRFLCPFNQDFLGE